MGLLRLTIFSLAWLHHIGKGQNTNLPPLFIKDMNNVVLPESMPVGQVVYTLEGTDPEGSPVIYGLAGTDKFIVNPTTGEVTLVQPLDREVNDTLKFLVSIEDKVDGPGTNNLVQVPVSVIVLDENDNAPTFKNGPYEADVPENEAVGTTILRDILVEDKDSFGDTLEVGCSSNLQWPDACSVFRVVATQASQSQYQGALVLNAPLDYNHRQFYQFFLFATDGVLNSTTSVEIRVKDIQNLPPMFVGSLAAVLPEDSPIGTLALTVQARDGDRAQPRNISYDLLTNPLDFFLLDSQTGELKTAKPLDREALPDPSAPLNLTVRAREIVDGQPIDSDMTTTLATLTVTIRDVNDEPPRFNRREYSVDIPENIAAGTPLPNLDMVVTDPDVGTNSTFSLRLSDVSGAFSVEPSQATGSTQVTIRLNNNTLDYENPNQRKFIILVIAEELHTNPRLSSTATVTVTVSDVNDNAPKFQDEAYSASVSETAPAGTHVTTIVAHDVDHARFGSEGIVYQMFGNGVDLFKVDNRTGMISVVGCETPGAAPCLDYETKQDYFLNYRATDDDGSGQTNMVSLKISVTDANDNPPIFDAPIYRASIDEDATKFEPELQVQARDADKTSEIRYSILDTNENTPFLIDSVNGKIRIKPGQSLETENKNNLIVLRILATDGVHNATCEVHITVRDVNNHAPVFDSPSYKATVVENEPIGTEVGTVSATDQDSGVNAEIKYFIQKGALDSFTIDNVTGRVSVASKLDYDKRNTYHIQIIAADQGTPSLTGTTTLTVSISNANDKSPSFTPQIQRAEVSADADIGTLIHNLIAKDPDILSNEDLKFELGSQPLKAVDKNGKEVEDNSVIDSWFRVSPDGRVNVAHKLDRNVAAVVTLPVIVEDTTAPTLQQADGELIISIVDVNRHPPVFSQSHYTERLTEEQPPNTVLGTYEATDKDSAISHYAIEPPSKYFKIDNITGTVRSTQRIDYERVRRIDFNVVAYDAGAPQLSATASVAVDVVNVNDEEPHFDEKVEYEATVKENSPPGTPLLFVHASDADEGQYGEVRYSLTGEHADMFSMDPETGEVKVAEGADIDRETTADIWLQAIASDNAPPNTQKTASIPIHIKVLDENDNEPMFMQKVYKNTIAENLQLNPPAPILQVRAEDKDVGKNGEVKYAIVEQTVPGAFQLNAGTGILFPAAPMVGNTTHHLRISATDGAGSGPHTVLAEIDIDVKSVNQHKPTFVTPAATQTAIEIPENAAQADLLVMTVKAVDPDSGENGRISYFLKVANQNVHETADFTLDEYTGELRTKNFLDREQRDSYSLVLVATDNGMPAPFEVIHFLNVVLKDSNDNKPQFPKELYEFTISENQPVGIIIGTVRAMDKDSGENGKVYYHVVQGNQNGAFTLDKTQGILKANMSFDREAQSEYMLTVYASNNPILDGQTDELNTIEDAQQDALNGTLSYKTEREKVVTHIVVRILDENDNEPKFEKTTYFAGIKYTAKVNELILPVQATDPDFEANGTISYLVAASNLYKFGSQQSSGSIVPSPFNITQDGLLLTANFMAEYNQDRFVLQLIAQETEPPHRQAKAQVYLWIVSVEQLVRVVLSRPCGVAERSRGELERRLSEATDSIVVVSAVKHYVHTARLYEDWCEIHLHAVDPTTYTVLPVDKVLELIDTQYDGLKDLYQESGIETVIAASASGKVRESFDPALAALIALLIVLFTGIVTFIVVCSCLKHWVIAPPSMESSKGDSLARRRILEELSTTENPLWLENKLRPYEEQELTMNVFGEQNEGGQAPAGNNDQLPPVDNTYATIQGGGGEREYATLPNRSAAARSESPTPLEAMLGFQGSTFQPPMAPDTPEPPPRPSIGLNHHVANI